MCSREEEGISISVGKHSPCVIKSVYSITFSSLTPLEQPGSKDSLWWHCPTVKCSSQMWCKSHLSLNNQELAREEPLELVPGQFVCFCAHLETPSKKCVEIISLYFCNPPADIRSEDAVCSVLSDTEAEIQSGLIIHELPLCLCAWPCSSRAVAEQGAGSWLGSSASQQGHLQLTCLPFQSHKRKMRYPWSYFGCLSYKQSSQCNAQLFVPLSKSLQHCHVRITRTLIFLLAPAVLYFFYPAALLSLQEK